MVSFTPLLDNTMEKPIYYQLYEYIKNEIISGKIKSDTRLPSLRKLSKYLSLSKNTVEAAYQQLYAEGYIESVPKIGYKVVDIKSDLYKMQNSSSRGIISYEKTPAVRSYKYDFTPKNTDKTCFDIAVWKKLFNSALNEEGTNFFSYGDPQGDYELREEIAKYIYENRGANCHPSQIVLGAGTQYCLSFLCQMLRPNYDTVGMEDPGSDKFRFIFERHQFEVKPIAVHDQGIDIKQLEESKSKIVFVTPSNQYPKSIVMSVSNRLQLLNWAECNDGIIIEDDYDSEMRFAGKPVPSLKSLDSGDKVIYLGSFSKVLLPAVRVSYMVLPKWLLELYLEKFSLYEQTTSIFNQKALARFMKEGHLQSHVRKIRRHYQNKYNTITKAIQTHMADNVKLISTSAGLRVILELKTDLSEAEVIKMARGAGIDIWPISKYYMGHNSTEESGKVVVILSYRGIPIEHIEEAIIALKKAWFDNFN
ncbi:PLP-dependent aminotransferase family protein [Clostridium omnivorum]|uniref:GntR family transcriptional regulator n=1 Tax=Clostridium omnivorum TaxID=1604902 RepID=A0ABQ5N6G8_9CLOT|nr:PLP-dependent aminotransferase family protein [Clostridium sp. E14]GLC30797.1 GntR family transcriptional regulator [Clostridium sp. E14]